MLSVEDIIVFRTMAEREMHVEDEPADVGGRRWGLGGWVRLHKLFLAIFEEVSNRSRVFSSSFLHT